MPIRPENRQFYGPAWREISRRIREERAGGRCEWLGCEAVNGQPHPITGSRVVLTVMHMDHDPTNNAEDNLRAACQRCHNRHDAPFRAANRARSRARASD